MQNAAASAPSAGDEFLFDVRVVVARVVFGRPPIWTGN